MQEQFSKMKVEVSDSGTKSLKEHFARHQQEFLSEAVMKILPNLSKGKAKDTIWKYETNWAALMHKTKFVDNPRRKISGECKALVWM